VKLDIGGVKYFALLLGPPMEALGLPPEFSLIWATAILTNMTAGILILLEIMRNQTITTEQITILATLMLLAHSLPVEARVAQKAGLRLRVTLVLRIGGAFVLAWILHRFYSHYGLLQEPFSIVWQPETSDDSLMGWVKSQIYALIAIQIAIILLLFLLKVLKLIGVEQLMVFLLTPLLKLLGIRKEAASLSIVGITLGLSYGGGLLMNEAAKGHLSRQDIFASLSVLGLCHSMIDDTLLMLLIGADVNAIIWARLLFSVLVTAMLVKIAKRLPQAIWDRYLVRWNA
jgi:spore maturation protein SpmB